MSPQRPGGGPRSDAPEETLTLGTPVPGARPDSERPSGNTQEDTSRVGAIASPPPGRVLAERYTVLDVLGHGGFGLVISAYDVRLNRRVALKLLRPVWSLESDDADQVRLLREAQAMARLNHPNVVHVYDSGRLEDESVFIAMEYVEGRTLLQWLRQQPRPWREVLRAFLEAGRGLAAAHDAGLVHRDFKPENVLVGEDGRVRVTDFGLAQAAHGSGTDDAPEAAPLPRTWTEPLTESGKVVGTPRYMAPEQLQGRAVDARTDLYGFCVALYEGLYGVRPFAGDTFGAILDARVAERVIPPPPDSEVPAWVARAVLRGLKADPLQRPASMRELLLELEDDPEQRRRARLRAAVLAGGGVLLLVTAVWGWLRQEAPASPCVGMEGRLAGVWDARLRERLQEVMAQTGLPQASDTFGRAAGLLDAYAAGWVKQRAEACEQARQEWAEQPHRLAALREYCLERRRGQLGALTELLVKEPDPKLVGGAVQAVQSLPPLSDCADARLLTAQVPPPEDPEVRARVEAFQLKEDRLEALHRAGRYKEGLAFAEALRPEVKSLGYPPLQGKFLYWHAMHLDGAGDYRGAESLLREVLVLAAQGRDAMLESRAWSFLVTEVGARQARYAEALWLELPLLAAAERLGDDQHLAVALETLGTVRWMTGEHERSREYYERALALLEKASAPESLDRANLLNNLGNVLMDQGQHAEAREHFERALAIKQRLLGDEHPSIAVTLNNLGIIHEELGEYALAQAHHERALAMRRKTLGPEHPMVASSLTNLGDVLLARGHLEEALEHHQRALALKQQTLGAGHPSVATSYASLGEVLAALEQHGRAREHFEHALALRERMQGADPTEAAEVSALLGRTLVRLGRWDEAARHLQRVRDTGERVEASDPRLLALARFGLGELHLARRQPTLAMPLLERSLEHLPVRVRAEAWWTLARALWDGGTERPRAVELATRAREHYRQAGNERKLALVSQWLLSHSGSNASGPRQADGAGAR
ncbi:tetratricopeptide repeat protein [Pyxidicoccus fallax]|uniref:Serine/threonine protein kinase n=1 Tax=Pyxidicoccus fallax TaxID=394095 RepID=A0A848LP90_9BACT|nr:serine/threonine-protein kinase [Pyxidicoccus fallax]NMO19511.1 serine/threonine protein kinase [Pyxidicoccus fallax]NPC79925.1 tetratricopeptide repeat protein [Pyxidicoccus fallax]